MKFTPLSIPDLILVQPHLHQDQRGYFFESFHQLKFSTYLNQTINFVQDNQSFSKKNVLRGLHFQINPHQQGKLVRVLSGKIFDVAVDLRYASSTFGQWVGHILDDEKQEQLWIPEGFAHGFYAFQDSVVSYKQTAFYSPEHEQSIRWNDPLLSIDWPLFEQPNLSSKDQTADLFNTQKIYFK